MASENYFARSTLVLRAAVRLSYFRTDKKLESDFRGQKKEAPPLPLSQRPFAIQSTLIRVNEPFRRRLQKNLPASDHSPFIVELFTFADLTAIPERCFLPADRFATVQAPYAGSR